MNKHLEQNFDALIAYSFSDKYQLSVQESSDINDLINDLTKQSENFLQVFNTFKDKIITDSDLQIMELIKLLTKRKFFLSLVNKNSSINMKEVDKYIKLKENIKELSFTPEFSITDKEYEIFFNMAEKRYLDSHLYHEKRLLMGVEIAEHSFYYHWSVLGEVFNRTIAKHYADNVEKRSVEKIPLIYKHTLSGHKYFEENKLEETTKLTF